MWITMEPKKIAVFGVAVIVALLHAPYVRAIFFSTTVGGYFLVATILFAIGAFATLTSGRLLKLAFSGLLALSIIDCALIYATRTFPTPFFGGRVLGWSSGWMPPGTVQVFTAQVVLIVVTAYALIFKIGRSPA